MQVKSVAFRRSLCLVSDRYLWIKSWVRISLGTRIFLFVQISQHTQKNLLISKQNYAERHKYLLQSHENMGPQTFQFLQRNVCQRESVSLSCISYVISYACVWDVWERSVSRDCLSPPRKTKPKTGCCHGIMVRVCYFHAWVFNRFLWHFWYLIILHDKSRGEAYNFCLNQNFGNHCLENNNGTNTVVLSKYWNVKKYR